MNISVKYIFEFDILDKKAYRQKNGFYNKSYYCTEKNDTSSKKEKKISSRYNDNSKIRDIVFDRIVSGESNQSYSKDEKLTETDMKKREEEAKANAALINYIRNL